MKAMESPMRRNGFVLDLVLTLANRWGCAQYDQLLWVPY